MDDSLSDRERGWKKSYWKELRFSARPATGQLAMTAQCSRTKSTGNARQLNCG
jgi:hypothetical protein